MRGRQYEPDLVIFFEAINDLVGFSPPVAREGRVQTDYSHYLGPYARLLGRTPGSSTRRVHRWRGTW